MARSTLPLLMLAFSLLLLQPSAPLALPTDEEEPAAPATTVVEEFVAPQIILGTQQRPVFPPAAWDARFTGSVLLEMSVLEDGRVGEVAVLDCTRPKVGFEEAAIAAVKQWQFEPGQENGQPIEVTTRLKLNFTRVGVGLQAKPQVSAGSFSVASRDMGLSSGDESSSTSVGSTTSSSDRR